MAAYTTGDNKLELMESGGTLRNELEKNNRNMKKIDNKLSGGVSEIPLQNGWTSLNPSYYGNLTATKILDKVVVLQGMISGDVSDNGTVVANIPAGFRPSKNLYAYVMVGTSSFTRVLINVSGNISIASNDAPAQMHINNIVFMI